MSSISSLPPLLTSWPGADCGSKTRLGVDCGSDHELLIAKFRFLMLGTIKTLEVSNILKVAQMVKNPLAIQEIWVHSLGWEDPLEKKMATHSSILAWKIP